MTSGEVFLQEARVLITRHRYDRRDTVRITLYTDPAAIRGVLESVVDETQRDILVANCVESAMASVNRYIGCETGCLYVNLLWDMRATDDPYISKYNWVRCVAPLVEKDLSKNLAALRPSVNHQYYPWFDCTRPITRDPGLICSSNPVVSGSMIRLWDAKSLKSGDRVYDPEPCVRFLGSHYSQKT